MNPNPYRTALLTFALLGLGLGILLILIGVAGTNVTTSFNLGYVGGFLVSVGATLFTLWLIASAIIYGLTVTPKLTPSNTIGSWLGFAQTQTPPQPSYMDHDGL